MLSMPPAQAHTDLHRAGRVLALPGVPARPPRPVPGPTQQPGAALWGCPGGPRSPPAAGWGAALLGCIAAYSREANRSAAPCRAFLGGRQHTMALEGGCCCSRGPPSPAGLSPGVQEGPGTFVHTSNLQYPQPPATQPWFGAGYVPSAPAAEASKHPRRGWKPWGSLLERSSAGGTHAVHQPAARHGPRLTRGFSSSSQPRKAAAGGEAQASPPASPAVSRSDSPRILHRARLRGWKLPRHTCAGTGPSPGAGVRARCQPRPRCTPGRGSQPHRAL